MTDLQHAGHASVTIHLLPASLSLVHVPRVRLTELSHPILKQVLQPQQTFLSLTCNELELSIFAEDAVRAEFEPIARRDRQRVRRRAEKAGAGGRVHRRGVDSGMSDEFQPVEISFEKWKVLQIDSHEDSLSNSGSRVRELSAPLAAAGISILYQSSYMSDFIFVKAARLAAVLALLGTAGFTLYNTDPLASLLPAEGLEDDHDDDDGRSGARSPVSAPNADAGAVLSRTRSPSLASLSALQYTLSRTSSVLTMDGVAASLPSSGSGAGSSPSVRTPKKSLSPTAAPVDVLRPDLACVGLTEGDADLWSLKIVKLVSFPELIPAGSSAAAAGSSSQQAYSRSGPLDSLYAPAIPRIRRSSPAMDDSDDAALETEFESEVEGGKLLHASRRGSSGSGDEPSSRSPSSLSSCSSSDGENEMFYSAPGTTTGSTPSLVSGTSSSRSLPELSRVRHASSASRAPRRQAAPVSRTAARERTPHTVPFFSFTRTAEGSSLTTDVRALAALFAPHERHMLICREDLLDAAERADELEDGEFEEGDDDAEGTMKCLQIDLQRFGLDKHGLVNRFSRVLEENGINHMYSSTYKTANLLVGKANAGRAQSLLRAC